MMRHEDTLADNRLPAEGMALHEVSSPAEVFVVDDDPAIRDALSIALRSQGHLVVCFSDAKSLLDLAAARQPGVIVLDVMLPDMSGIAVLKQLRATGHAAPVLVITGHGDIPMAVEAIKLGAFDFVEKPFPMALLLERLQAALAASRQHDADRASSFDFATPGGVVLTRREKEVLREIAAGASSREAGRILAISPRTVEVHRARIMDKLGARNAADLMRIIFSHDS